MIIVLVSKLSNGDEAHAFGGIACDVEGCDVHEPQPPANRKDLAAEGWFIAPGKHRCPAHRNEDVPGRGTEHRYAEVISKRI